jgi:hypothetical protein
LESWNDPGDGEFSPKLLSPSEILEPGAALARELSGESICRGGLKVYDQIQRRFSQTVEGQASFDYITAG